MAVSDLNEVLTESREPLLFIPMATFGYLYVHTGIVWFLVAAIVVSINPVLVIEANLEFRMPRERSVGKVVSSISFIIWAVSYPAGVIFTWMFMDNTDIILVGLLLANVIFLMVLITPVRKFYEESTK